MKIGTNNENKNIIEGYRKYDNRIKVVVNEKNQGLVKSLNKAIDIVNTKYIARMDSDDISAKNRLEKQIDFLEKNNQYVLVGTIANYINEKGKYKESQFYGEVKQDMLIKFCAFFHPSLLIKTEVLKQINGYEEYERNEDYALYFKLYYLGYKGYVLQDILLNYRQDIKSFERKKYKDRFVEFKIRRKYLKLLKIKLPKKILYTIKPLVVGCIPKRIMYLYKKFKKESK